MLIRLFAYKLFNFADNLLDFPGILLGLAISFQVGVPGKFADFLLD
jgi:hypothetical protein